MRVRKVVRRRRDGAIVDRVRLLDAAAARRNRDGRASSGAAGARTVGASTAFRVGARDAEGSGRSRGRRRRIFFGNIVHFGRRFGRRLRFLRRGCGCAATATLLMERAASAFVIAEANFAGPVVVAAAAAATTATIVVVAARVSRTAGVTATTTVITATVTNIGATATAVVVVILIRTVIVIRVGGGTGQRRRGIVCG